MKSKYKIIFMISIFTSLQLSCNSHEKAPVSIPEIEIVKEDIYDAPIKSQITQYILIKSNISKDGLEILLHNQFEMLMKRSGFKYRKNPTNIYIFVYNDKEKAIVEQGLWLAMLEFIKNYNDKPVISIREEQIALLRKKPEEKFGLTEAQRKEIFKEIIKTERRSIKEAEKLYPSNLKKQVVKADELNEKFQNMLAKKYNLSSEHLDSIGMEGIKNLWVRPSLNDD